MLQCVRICLYISFELQDFFLFRSRLSQSVTVPFSVPSIYASVNRLVLYILLWALFWDIWTIISCVFNPIYIASIASLFHFLFRDMNIPACTSVVCVVWQLVWMGSSNLKLYPVISLAIFVPASSEFNFALVEHLIVWLFHPSHTKLHWPGFAS